MISNAERHDQQLKTELEAARRRIAERRRKGGLSAGRQALAGAGVALALIGIGFATKPSSSNPEKAKLRAALIKKEIKTANPNIVIEPYTVGDSPEGVMISEVAADLHPMLSDSSDAMEQISTLQTYLSNDQENIEQFTPGEQLDIAINTESGTILPKSEVPDSATWQR